MDDTKELALSVLLERAGQTYVPSALEFVKVTAGKDQSSRFSRVFNIGNQFYTFSDKNQTDALALGFTILEAEAKLGTSMGYGLARLLGTFVEAPGEFASDTLAPLYQGKNGLNEQFFSDTVENALDWRRKNPSGVSTKP